MSLTNCGTGELFARGRGCPITPGIHDEVFVVPSRLNLSGYTKNSEGLITAHSHSASTNVYTLQHADESAAFTGTMTRNRVAQTATYISSLNLRWAGMNQSTNNLVEELVAGKYDFYWFDNMEQLWCLEGCYLETLDFGQGQNSDSEDSGYNFVMQNRKKHLPRQCIATLLDTMIIVEPS